MKFSYKKNTYCFLHICKTTQMCMMSYRSPIIVMINSLRWCLSCRCFCEIFILIERDKYDTRVILCADNHNGICTRCLYCLQPRILYTGRVYSRGTGGSRNTSQYIRRRNSILTPMPWHYRKVNRKCSNDSL